MEGLLTNNIFFVYLLGVLVIINYEVFAKKQKIAIIYACSFGLTFNSDLRCTLILIFLLFILFLYEEYLNEDIVKIKYVTKISHKLLDFIYMYIFQYKILYILTAIILKSKTSYLLLEQFLGVEILLKTYFESILIIISILLLIIGIHKIFNNPVEIKSFKQINQKFSEYPYYNLPLREESKRTNLVKKLELVADIEDYTFLIRKNSYNSFSLEFVNAVVKKKKCQKEIKEGESTSYFKYFWWKVAQIVTLHNFVLFCKSKYKIQLICKYKRALKRLISNFFVSLNNRIKKFIKTNIRGYSTIEMQLIRILSYKKGLKMGRPHNLQEVYLIISRKIYEIIYTTIFFTGLKKYIIIPKEKDYFKYYIVYIYLHTVQTNLNGKVFAPLDKIFGDVDVIDWPMEALFIIALGLNHMKITRNRIEKYMYVITKYQLNENLIDELVDCIN